MTGFKFPNEELTIILEANEMAQWVMELVTKPDHPEFAWYKEK